MSDPRHTPADTKVTYTRLDGSVRTLQSEPLADGYHYIRPSDLEDEAVLASLDYPVARKAIAQPRRKAAPKSNPEPRRKAARKSDTTGPKAETEA